MIIYLVIQTDYSDFSGKEKLFIKGVFDLCGIADKHAHTLYKSSIEYRNSEGTYDTVEYGKYEEFQPKDGGGVEIVSRYRVVEVEYEINRPTEIEI